MEDSPRPFAHLDAPNAELYRRCMSVFVASKRRFVVHLRPEDVAESLRADGTVISTETVAEALDRLRQWGNLRADPDTGRVVTVEDFYRARYLYQFSREGEAAERALETYEQMLGRRGELQAVALEDIRLRLRALRDLAAQPDPDPAVVHSLLLELTGRLDSLADNAGAFMASLQRTIDLQDVDEDAFLIYKDRLIAYLERFVSDLVIKSYDVAGTLRSFPPDRTEALLRMAAAREAVDVAPGPQPAEPDPGSAGRSAAAEKLDQWRSRWTGLWSWFVGDRTHPSQASLLRQRARKAIPDLLTTLSVLHERRAGRSDRSADFRQLARWFAACDTDEEAHRLWRAAFGLASSRHLGGAAPDDAVAPATSWRDAPPVTIAARLRATGRYQRRGGLSRVVDRSAARQRLAERAAAERVQTEAAIRRLATGQPTRLGDLDQLDRHEFALFLHLLGEALAAGPPGRDGAIRTRTADGSLELTLRRVPDGDTITITTEDGVLHGPDHEITVADLRVAVPEAAR